VRWSWSVSEILKDFHFYPFNNPNLSVDLGRIGIVDRILSIYLLKSEELAWEISWI
jgi:hypothetical protein